MKVGYSKTFPIYGKEEWEKNWLECDVSMPGDLINLSDEDIAKYMLNVRRVQYALKKQVEGFHYESNKAEEKKAKGVKAEKQEVKPVTIEDINSCKDLTVLVSYRLIVKSNPDLQKAYDEQYKKLSPKHKVKLP